MTDNAEAGKSDLPVDQKPLRRKPLISPTSSFIDFVELESEIYTEEDRANAHLYDPAKDRNIKKPTTTFETSVHLLKGSIGAGVLAMPKAFSNAGYVIGIPGVIILGSLCVYGIHVMISMRRIQCKRLRVPFLTLPRAFKIAFLNGPPSLQKLSSAAPYIVDFCLVANQIGLCATYLLFIAQSIKDVMEGSVFDKSKDYNVRAYVAALFLPVLLVTYIRNLKKMMFVSLTADLLMATAFACCFYYIFGTGPLKPHENGVVGVAAAETIPLFMATVIFALEAVGVMVALEHNMKNPEHFLGRKGIFPWCMGFIIFLYMALGLSGYMKYGRETKNTIMHTIPQDEIVANLVRTLIALAIFGSYPLQCYVGLEIIWGNYLIHYIKNMQNQYLVEYILRTVVVVFTFLVALINPDVELVISLVGALCLSTLGLIIPFFMEICTVWPDYGRYNHVLVKDILMIIFGFFILLTGTTVSMIELTVKWLLKVDNQ